LRNPDNIRREEDRVRLDELPAANRKLAKLYIHQQDLKALWDYRHVGYAWRFWLDWQARAIRSRIEPLKAFARRLKAKIDGVPAHCRRPLRTSLLEGINNKIKVIKRMACQSAAKVAWVPRIAPDRGNTAEGGYATLLRRTAKRGAGAARATDFRCRSIRAPNRLSDAANPPRTPTRFSGLLRKRTDAPSECDEVRHTLG